MIRAEWTNNDALSAEQATHSNAPNTLNAMDCISRKERGMNFDNVACCERSEPKAETVKSILENMDAILKEMGTELRHIEGAIYWPSDDGCDVNEPRDECLLGMLNRQRNLAESLLMIVVHIREGLW